MSKNDPSPSPAKGVVFVLVGHCGADSYSISRAVQRAVPDSVVVTADNDTALATRAAGAVLLINRVLDGGFRASGGIELIQSLAKREPKPVMTLISNYTDAQDAAIAAGAVPGFGKSELGSTKATEILRTLATMATSAASTKPSPMPRSAEASG